MIILGRCTVIQFTKYITRFTHLRSCLFTNTVTGEGMENLYMNRKRNCRQNSDKTEVNQPAEISVLNLPINNDVWVKRKSQDTCVDELPYECYRTFSEINFIINTNTFQVPDV